MASTAVFTTPALSDSARADGKAPQQQRPGFFVRVMQSLAASRQRRADLSISRFIASHGGKMTDSVERQIEWRFLNF